MAHIESTSSTIAPPPSWADAMSPERNAYSVPPPPANRHIVPEADTSSTATQFVAYGESNGIRNINDRRRLLRLFDDFKGNSGADNRDEFSRVLFEMSRNQKLIRVIGGVTIEWNDGAPGSAPRHVSSARDTRDTRDFNRHERPSRDNYERDTRDTRRDTRDFNRPERPPRDNYERDYVRPERPRDNEDPRDRRITELTRTILSMEKTMERMQNRLDSVCRDR
jgi:hypothetical protein